MQPVAVRFVTRALARVVESTFSVPVIVVLVVVFDCYLASLFPLLFVFLGDLRSCEYTSAD